MNNLSIKKITEGNIETVIEKVTEAIKPAGFGVLTRIDFDKKIMEKLNEKIPQTVILGACNPKLAFEVYQQTTDMTLLIPCNITVRAEGNKVIVEAIKPSAMINFLPNVKTHESLQIVEKQLAAAIESI